MRFSNLRGRLSHVTSLFAIAALGTLLLSSQGFADDGPGTPLAGPTDGVDSPVRIVLGQGSELFVTDYDLKRVLMVDREDLTVVGDFSVVGRPLGLAFDGEFLYVGNETSGAVDVYNLEGDCVSEFDLSIAQPNDIALAPVLDLALVVSSQEDAVHVFNLDGEFLRSIPESSEEPLGSPTGIALYRPGLLSDINDDGIVDVSDLIVLLGTWGTDGEGAELADPPDVVDVNDLLVVLGEWGDVPPPPEVVISDYGDPVESIAPALRIYDLSGRHLRTITGDFSRPQGMAIDAAGIAFVADALLSQVLAIDLVTGEIHARLGAFGTEPGQLRLPLDVVIEDGSMDLFVTNNQNSRIEAFREGAQLP